MIEGTQWFKFKIQSYRIITGVTKNKGVAVGEKSLHAFRKSEVEVQFSIILFSLPPYNLLILQKQ